MTPGTEACQCSWFLAEDRPSLDLRVTVKARKGQEGGGDEGDEEMFELSRNRPEHQWVYFCLYSLDHRDKEM